MTTTKRRPRRPVLEHDPARGGDRRPLRRPRLPPAPAGSRRSTPAWPATAAARASSYTSRSTRDAARPRCPRCGCSRVDPTAPTPSTRRGCGSCARRRSAVWSSCTTTGATSAAPSSRAPRRSPMPVSRGAASCVRGHRRGARRTGGGAGARGPDAGRRRRAVARCPRHVAGRAVAGAVHADPPRLAGGVGQRPRRSARPERPLRRCDLDELDDEPGDDGELGFASQLLLATAAPAPNVGEVVTASGGPRPPPAVAAVATPNCSALTDARRPPRPNSS